MRGMSQSERSAGTQVTVSSPLVVGRLISAVVLAMSSNAFETVGKSNAPCGRELQALRATFEQLDIEDSLQCFDLMADRAMRDIEFTRSGSHGAMPRRRLEGAQWVQRGQTAWRHRTPLAVKRHKVM